MSTGALAPWPWRRLRLLGVATIYELRKATAFRVGFLLREVIGGLARPIVMCFVFLAIYRSSGTESINGYSFEAMVGYLLLAAVLFKLLTHEWLLDLSEQIFEGYVTKFFVMPFAYFTMILARWLQYLGVQALVVAILWLAGSLLAPEWWPRPERPVALLQALLLVLLGSYCYLLTYFILHTLAFWLDVVWTLLVMTRFIIGFVSGLIIPISMMPTPVQVIFAWAYPYWALCAPVELVLGRLGTADFLRGLLVLSTSAVLLQLLATFTWRRGLARYSGAGM